MSANKRHPPHPPAIRRVRVRFVLHDGRVLVVENALSNRRGDVFILPALGRVRVLKLRAGDVNPALKGKQRLQTVWVAQFPTPSGAVARGVIPSGYCLLEKLEVEG